MNNKISSMQYSSKSSLYVFFLRILKPLILYSLLLYFKKPTVVSKSIIENELVLQYMY